ncbi:MAG: hypothetical protein KDB22_18495 [Planctomycetales bacterium]|nr:hypothetical protein [Planctomycetales bacterium]
MRKLLAKWIICRCVDSNLPLPGWIVRRSRRDPSLARFHQQTASLVGRLRAEASTWAGKHNHNQTADGSQTVNHEKVVAKVTILAQAGLRSEGKQPDLGQRTCYVWVSAAVIVLAVGLWSVRATHFHNEKSSQAVTIAPPSDLRSVLATASASRQVFDKLAYSTHHFVDRLYVAASVLELDQHMEQAQSWRYETNNMGQSVNQSLSRVARVLVQLAERENPVN